MITDSKGVETMFKIKGTTFHITRGDMACFDVGMKDENNNPVNFKPGDIVRFRVFVKKHYDKSVLVVDVSVQEETETVTFVLTGDKTKIGDVIHKQVEYWYEVERNPDTPNADTFIGTDDTGEKLFILYPEGVDPE